MIWKKKGVRDPAQNISGFGALTSREPCVAPPKCLVQPGNGGEVGEVGNPFMPSSRLRDIALWVFWQVWVS